MQKLVIFLLLISLPALVNAQASFDRTMNDTCYRLFQSYKIAEIQNVIVLKVSKMGLMEIHRFLKQNDSIRFTQGTLFLESGRVLQVDTFPNQTTLKEKSILLSALLDPVNYERSYTENGTVFMEAFTESMEVDHLLLFIDAAKKISSLLMVSSTHKNFLCIDYLQGINQNAIWLNSKGWNKLCLIWQRAVSMEK